MEPMELEIIPTPNFKVAFIGDQGLGQNSLDVLSLIKEEKAQMVLHQGDFDYLDNPEAWNHQINQVLGPNFPYFASSGGHDIPQWDKYQNFLRERLSRINGVTCTGNLGVQSSCSFNGLFFILSGANLLGTAHESFIRNELSNNPHLWRICSWHETMTNLQVGLKTNTTGYEIFEECRKNGAIIVTGHEHSYHRTKTLVDMQRQIIDPEWLEPNNVRVSKGSSFVIVSGLGGVGIRAQERCLPISYPYGCDGIWANIYSTSQNATYGALFCSFNVDNDPRDAKCYFKDIKQNIIDKFMITNQIQN